MLVQHFSRQTAGLAVWSGRNARVVECLGNCLLISGSQVRVLLHPLFWDVHHKFPCVPMRRSGREGRAFTHCSQRRPLRPFPRAALPISAKRRAPGIEPDPNRLIHIRLSAAPDGGRSAEPCRRFPSDEAAGSASSGKSPESPAPTPKSEGPSRRRGGTGSGASIAP